MRHREHAASPDYCRVAVLMVLVLFASTGCVKTVDVPGPTGDASGGESQPCELFSPGDLELALNVPVEALNPAGRPIVFGMQMCMGGSDGSVAVWGVLDQSVGRRVAEYQRVNEEYLEGVKVNGNEGLWDQRLGTLLVEKGKRAFGIRVSMNNPLLKKGQTRAAHLKETAVQLAGNVVASWP